MRKFYNTLASYTTKKTTDCCNAEFNINSLQLYKYNLFIFGNF